MPEPRIPRIDSPRDGVAVDGLACTLAWSAATGASSRVQVSANERFDALLLDVDAGDATVLTLYELLPRDGRRLHWRVGSGETWSEPTWFLSADVEDRPRTRAVVRPEPTPGPAASSTAAPSDTVPLYLHATTGRGEALIALAVLVVTVVLLLAIVF